jgi:hypothetical protein
MFLGSNYSRIKKIIDEGEFEVGFILFLLISMKLKLWQMLI